MPSLAVVPDPVEVLDERARMLAELTGILSEARAEHVLIGGLAVGLYGRVRATVDVDLLVPGKLGCRVPVVRRGALVALKFHSAVSPQRRIEDRYQDVADIGRIVAKGFGASDAKLAQSIVRHIHPGAPAELDRLIDDLRSGRPVTI